MTIQSGTDDVEISHDYKVPNGKLLRCKATIQNGIITKILITGDFFIHPEDVIEKLEANLKGKDLNDLDITTIVNNSFSVNSTIVGFDKNDLMNLINQTIALYAKS